MSGSTTFWSQYRKRLADSLAAVQITDENGKSVRDSDGFDRLCEWTRQLAGRHTLYLTGNGASAGMASHLAADWSKNAGVRALAFNDSVLLTAIGNDLGFDRVFSGPLTWFADPGDMLVTVSSSGASSNVLKAIDVAKGKGLRVVTFSGMTPDNPSRLQGELNFYVPALTYGVVECAHQVLLHAWLDQYMDVREWEATSRQVPPQSP